MAQKKIGGISGVLGELISPTPVAEVSLRTERSSVAGRQVDSDNDPSPTAPRSQRARLGRPPGNDARHARPKEKVTLRIPSDLIAEYRDWSWEARCQLSELVVRALISYQDARRPRPPLPD